MSETEKYLVLGELGGYLELVDKHTNQIVSTFQFQFADDIFGI